MRISPLHAQQWEWRPWVTVAGGYENYRILDPTTDRFAAPGGGYLDLAPGATLSRRLGTRARIALNGQATFERFLNDQARSVWGGFATADLRGLLGGPVQWRFSLGGNYFADSERESVNRFGGGSEAALRIVTSRGYLEALGAIEGRRYGNLNVFDDSGVLGTYTEASTIVGAAGGLRATDGLALTARVAHQSTDARDSFYDATALLLQGSVQLRVRRLAWLSLNGLVQDRTFDSRLPGADGDSYWQAGVGLERALNSDLALAAKYAFARYEQSTSPDEDIHRLTIGVTWRFGGTPGPSRVNGPVAGIGAVSLREHDARLFRLHAPDAKNVVLVGDFNGWNPGSHPLQSSGDGWWELKIRLPAGAHQYAYLVDGTMVTPPDADVTVDDGFGGRNGLLFVESDSP